MYIDINTHECMHTDMCSHTHIHRHAHRHVHTDKQTLVQTHLYPVVLGINPRPCRIYYNSCLVCYLYISDPVSYSLGRLSLYLDSFLQGRAQLSNTSHWKDYPFSVKHPGSLYFQVAEPYGSVSPLRFHFSIHLTIPHCVDYCYLKET